MPVNCKNLTKFLKNVSRYEEEDKDVRVLQAGHHYIDIRTDGGLTVVLRAYFKCDNTKNKSISSWLIKAEILVDVSKGKVIAPQTLNFLLTALKSIGSMALVLLDGSATMQRPTM